MTFMTKMTFSYIKGVSDVVYISDIYESNDVSDFSVINGVFDINKVSD